MTKSTRVGLSILGIWISIQSPPLRGSFSHSEIDRQDSRLSAQEAPTSSQEGDMGLLKLLGIEVSPESIDYVLNKEQFQLHTLLTEQRHPKTWNLSEKIRTDTLGGLRQLSSVDEDIALRLETLAAHPQILEEAAGAVEDALRSGEKIYIYGCGATGRLAKQMESAFWRPFWKKVKGQEKIWLKLKATVPEDIEDRLMGEMTGADRALISSLEGFEDLALIGRLQLAERGVQKGDVVICVTEGGETSSVIGTILAALDQWKAAPGFDPVISRQRLYFVYNNPDEKLLPFERSRKVIEEPGITKINLTTGPQAITGSTRMQAATIETYVVGNILQDAANRLLGKILASKEMAKIGFDGPCRINDNLRAFSPFLDQIKSALPALTLLTDAEKETYATGRYLTYFAGKGLMTVFIDSAERSPTFRLLPLDSVKEQQKKCWLQVWTDAPDLKSAWLTLLGRPFRGLDPDFYRTSFENEIEDPFLRTAALESLKRAGNDQADLYDFSFSDFNLNRRGPKKGDLGVEVLLAPEEKELEKEDSSKSRFVDLFLKNNAKIALVLVGDLPEKTLEKTVNDLRLRTGADESSLLAVPVHIDSANDPFGLKQAVAAKILLNAHSTAVMAKLGKVIGNTMTNVNPGNLKLIGRATFLIQSHVNDVLSRPAWVKVYGRRKSISYGEANAVLFDSLSWLKGKPEKKGQTAEVALSIIRILESLKENRGFTSDKALDILNKKGLALYLSEFEKS